VLFNHNAMFIAHPRGENRCHVGNPCIVICKAAAKAVNLAFICNVVLNARQEILFVAAAIRICPSGSCDMRERIAGLSCFLRHRNHNKRRYPLDQNIYQA
jgi:nickel-dependent lactate racemase